MAYRNPVNGNIVERSSNLEHSYWIGTFGMYVQDTVDSVPYNDGISTLSRMADDKGRYTYVVCLQGTPFKHTPFERDEYLSIFCELREDGNYYFLPSKCHGYLNNGNTNNNDDSDSDDGEQMAMYADMLNSKD